MSWRQPTTELLGDILRFAIRGAFLINGIIVAFASIYFVAKVTLFTLRWANRVLFSAPW